MGTKSGPIQGWRLYNKSAIPTTAPHESPNLAPIQNGSIWHIGGKHPLLACYTTDWDCGYETGWWYCIKDTPFDISALKTKRRYEITKAMRFFDVKEILNPIEFVDSLAHVQEQSYLGYSVKTRPIFNKKSFVKFIETWSERIKSGDLKIFGAFYKETSELAGYNFIVINKTFLNFAVQKTNPEFEKFNVNAALVNGVLDSFKDKLSKGYYICDGTRSVNHETHFQDYLEKYFGFRKAYCKLKIAYPPPCKVLIAVLYPFRHFIDKLGSCIGVFHKISSIFKMEEIARNGMNLDA